MIAARPSRRITQAKRLTHVALLTGATAVACLFLLSGCGGGSDTSIDSTRTPQPTAATSTTAEAPVQAKSFSTVVQLRDVAIAAGLPCPNWKQGNLVSAAAQSGDCSGSAVLSTYTTAISLQRGIDNLQSMNAMMKTARIKLMPFLVGPNWIINWPKVATLVGGMGGTVQQ
jgi:hypothetical protein